MQLRAVVIGAGWAGEGHTLALRAAGVEVVALCGRTPEPARAPASELRLADVRFDWRAALAELRPEIVSIATPGDTHRAMAEHAAALGCHVMCEKPLAPTAADAEAMLLAVERAEVKHACAATACYSPATLHAAALLKQGVIGALVEIEAYGRFDFPVVPFGWVHERARGGGLLNNGFPHDFSQALRVSRGRPLRANGSTVP
jgi:predicted dehydrogenase